MSVSRRGRSFILLLWVGRSLAACAGDPGTTHGKHTGAVASDGGPEAAQSDSGAAADAGAPPSDAGAPPWHSDGGSADGQAPAQRFDVADGCATASPFATGVVDHEFGTGQDNNQDRLDDLVVGPPHGGGCCQGDTDDVVSLGNGGWVILEFENNAIVDGPGPDFIVFENAFLPGGTGDPFAELATVSVSEDGETWVDFPCTATEPPYGSCAGQAPVFANAETNDIDPTDPEAAGGDAFDLADIGLKQARFVKVTDREDLDGIDGVFDLDAVAIVHPLCP